MNDERFERVKRAVRKVLREEGYCAGDFVFGCAPAIATAALVAADKSVPMKPNQHAATVICELLETIDNRCLAVDGPVPPTLRVATDEELRRIYVAADEIRRQR